jgi:hypothetical protein
MEDSFMSSVEAGREKERERYLQWARNYFDAAKCLLDSGRSKQVVGHLIWTGTELSLKALAVGYTMPTVHDLDKVTSHLIDNGRLTEEDYANTLKPLYAHITGSATDYSAARYPPVNPGYWDSVTKEQQKMGLGSGLEVHDFVKKKIPTLESP